MTKLRHLQKTALLLAAMTAGLSFPGQARAAGTSGAISLREHGSARATGLADAVSAATDDVTLLQFNPASLGTLRTGQASMFFRRGLENQSEGRLHVGMPFARWTGGLSVGYFDGGSFDAVSGGRTRRVDVQRDLVATLGSAKNFGRLGVGVAAKYLSSTLIETEKASTVALDAGFQLALSERLRIAGAVQNIGRGLQYRSERDPLPGIVRAGVSYAFQGTKAPASLYADVPYLINDRDLQTALGLEVGVGPLMIRGGLARRFGDIQWTAGFGLGLREFSIDYGMAMLTEMSAQHQINLSLRFGAPALAPLAAKPSASPLRAVYARPRLDEKSASRPAARPRHVYIVKKGDTLATISKKMFGRTDLWRKIYAANAHVMNNPHRLEEGQRILLPAMAE